MQHRSSWIVRAALLGFVPTAAQVMPVVAQPAAPTAKVETLGEATQAELDWFNRVQRPKLVFVNPDTRTVEIQTVKVLAANVLLRDANGFTNLAPTQSLTQTFKIVLPADVPLTRLETKLDAASLKVGNVISTAEVSPLDRVPLKITFSGPKGPLSIGDKGAGVSFRRVGGSGVEQATVTALTPLTVIKDGKTRVIELGKNPDLTLDRLTVLDMVGLADALTRGDRPVVEMSQDEQGKVKVKSITMYTDGK